MSRSWLPAVAAVLRRPSLWGAAFVALARLAPPGWWRRPPFLPLPDRRWLAFRLTTAYGTPDEPLTPEDLVAVLRWSRRFPR